MYRIGEELLFVILRHLNYRESSSAIKILKKNASDSKKISIHLFALCELLQWMIIENFRYYKLLILLVFLSENITVINKIFASWTGFSLLLLF